MKKQKKNCLKPINPKIKQKLIYGFDIETHGKHNDFLMASVVSKEGKRVFWNKYDLLDYFFTNPRIKRNGLIFATNLYFDIFNTFKDTDLMEDLDVIFINGKLIYAKYQINDKEKVEFYDTLSFCHFGVGRIGKLVGLEKLDHEDLIGRDDLTMPEKRKLELYNIRDSEITYKFGEYLQDSFNFLGTNIKLTISSTAMNLFKQKYLNTKIYQPKKEIILKMFDGYYGARTETYIRGFVKDLHYYDINSLYPSVMINEYPHGSYSKYLKGIQCRQRYIDEFEGISYVKLELKTLDNNTNIPYLPMRFNNKLIFAMGKIEGWYTHLEIRNAMNMGYKLLKIRETIFYTLTHEPFKNYITDLYKKRLEFQKEGNPMEQTVKDLMNHLYGKMGQGIKDVETIKHQSKIENVDQIRKYDSIKREGSYFFLTEKVKRRVPSFVNPIYSIYTTAYARNAIYDYFNRIADKKKHIYYTDTDSLITDYRFTHSLKLGELKKEFSVIEGYIVKPKMYGFLKDNFSSTIKMKGIKSKGSTIINENNEFVEELKDYESFKRFVLSKQKLGFSFQTFSKFKQSIKTNISFNTIGDIQKFLSMEDNKRVWDRPFNPEELQFSNPLTM